MNDEPAPNAVLITAPAARWRKVRVENCRLSTAASEGDAGDARASARRISQLPRGGSLTVSLSSGASRKPGRLATTKATRQP